MAVNTVVQENGALTGFTTDGKGYMTAVKDAGIEIIGKKMTLLFQLGNSVYREVYQKVPELGK